MNASLLSSTSMMKLCLLLKVIYNLISIHICKASVILKRKKKGNFKRNQLKGARKYKNQFQTESCLYLYLQM